LVSGAKPVAEYPAQPHDNQTPFSSPPPWDKRSLQKQAALPPVAQTPLPQTSQMWQPDPPPFPLPTPEAMEAAVRNKSASDRRDAPTAGTLSGGQVMTYSKTAPAMQAQTRRTSNVGFIVAGLCVITGGLILVFVYFMALGLPSTNATSANTGTPATTSNTLTSLTATAPSPTALPSPTTGTFPGQQYIDNVQMASMVNTNTAQPLQTTTRFKVNQTIYVTFNIHPNGKSGAVCLLWYLNSRIVTHYPLAVTATANAGYSYAIYGGTGEAYVEIYWASSTACNDKILAQHVNFTVTR